MLYFIPAWYGDSRLCEEEQAWYLRRTQSEFDDTVKQVQLFQRNSHYPYKILLVSFNPNFRHFLHRQGVYHAPYWSCFDAICEIKRTKMRTLSIHDIAWPEGIEFFYTPFVIVAKLNGKKYAEVEHGDDGNPIRITMYDGNTIIRRNNYDDRGFLANTVVYENGAPSYEDFLNEKGERKFRYFYSDGHVEINRSTPYYTIVNESGDVRKQFSQPNYSCVADMVREVLGTYISLLDKNDTFCAAMSDLQVPLTAPLMIGRKYILSFFGNRISEAGLRNYWDIIRNAGYLITDSKENEELLINTFGDRLPLHKTISPFDTRVDLGISQQLTVKNIMLPVDDLSDEIIDKAIEIIGCYLENSKDARLHLFTRNADYNLRSLLTERVENIFRENDILTDSEEELPVFVDQCVDEIAVSKCMREQRLIIDLRTVPQLYLQISAVSMGIPQIVMKETQFVENNKNGMVLTSLDQLYGMLMHYLDTLTNWNQAMVAAYEIGQRYTTRVLVDSWEEVMTAIG